MNDDRDLVDQFLDAGATADWITPTYEAIRNIVADGESFCLQSDDWHALKWELQRRHIPFWGESLHWLDGAYWTTFSVHSENAVLVRELSGYRSNGGRGKAVVILLVLAAFFLGGMALVAAVGGAL